MRKQLLAIIMAAATVIGCTQLHDDGIKINEQGYFERPGVNILVFNNLYNGGFNDELAENEGTIANNAAYLNFGMVFRSLVEE